MKYTLINESKIPQNSQINNNDLETFLSIAELNLVMQEIEYFTGDDWLSLCGDIDSGEIYRNWFIWQDTELSQEWEAYDHVTNQRIIATNWSLLIAKIDRIENERNN
ncbi:hypothetical protein [Okeania sp.]|uniref:hypothetical protein n=1 Tax=Okeania sp. TaxID=3100323 RepID=UPI002B4AE7C0|nr:hypothetical protein [Okeania sp.]MEB3339963.1 hypothetical protein [Okeania sp.]